MNYQSSLLQNVIDSSTDWIFVKDLDFRYLLVNRAFAAALGRPPETIIGKDDLELGFSSEQVFGNLEKEMVGFRADDCRVIAGEVVLNGAEPVTMASSVIWMETKKLPLRDQEGRIFGVLGVCRDITERRQTEIKLIETQQFLESVLQTLPIAVVLKEAKDLRFALWNTAAANLFGITQAEVIGKNDYDFFPPAQADLFTQIDREVLSSGQVLTIPAEEAQIDGENRILSTKKTAILDAAGKPKYLVAMTEDITERKRAEAQLKEQEEFLRSIYDGVEYAIFVVDVLETGEFRYAARNAFGERLSGLTTAEIAGKTPEALYGEAEGALVRQTFQRCLQAGTQISEEEYLTFNGQKTWFLTTFNPLRNAEGRIYRIVGTSLDITDRKRVETALQEQLNLTAFRADVDASLTRSETLPNMLHDCTEAIVSHLDAAFARIWLLNPQENVLELQASSGMYTHLNGDHARVPVGKFKIGLIAEERRPHFTNSVLHDPRVGDKAWAEREKMVAFAGHPLMVENQLLGVVAMFARQPLSVSTMDALTLVAQEIALGIKRQQAETALRQSEIELRQKAQQLEQTLYELQHTQAQLVQTEKMSSLGQLVAGVAHEINNPVNFIYGNLTHAGDYAHDLLNLLELYQQHYPNPAPAIQTEAEEIDLDFLKADLPKLLSSMKMGADRIQQIVLALRTFSRMDEAELKPVNIHDGIDSTLMILQSRLKETAGHPGIAIARHYGDIPLVECYAGQLNQVFMNIVSNAIDALDELNSKRSMEELRHNPATITITTEQVCDHIQIRIADNGGGMNEQVQRRLFEPFFTTKPVGKGTGLGLSISYQVVVDKHGGMLTCRSAPGKGTEFVIELPLTLKARPHLSCG